MLNWLSEQSELIYSIRIMFSWMPERFADLCTMAVVITFLVAIVRLIAGVKQLLSVF